jgi:hypothetical protein
MAGSSGGGSGPVATRSPLMQPVAMLQPPDDERQDTQVIAKQLLAAEEEEEKEEKGGCFSWERARPCLGWREAGAAMSGACGS